MVGTSGEITFCQENTPKERKNQNGENIKSHLPPKSNNSPICTPQMKNITQHNQRSYVHEGKRSENRPARGTKETKNPGHPKGTSCEEQYHWQVKKVVRRVPDQR